MNKVMLIGNVGQEPEVRYVDQGVAVARIRLATTERGYTLQNGTQVPDHTDWHNVILWRRMAEIVEKYVHKGDKLYVEGRIRYTTYDDKQGQRRYAMNRWLLPSQTQSLTRDCRSDDGLSSTNPERSHFPDSHYRDNRVRHSGVHTPRVLRLCFWLGNRFFLLVAQRPQRLGRRQE